MVETQVQQQLLNKLKTMRYGEGPSRAARPKKKEKLPAGAAYTCGRVIPVLQEGEILGKVH